MNVNALTLLKSLPTPARTTAPAMWSHTKITATARPTQRMGLSHLLAFKFRAIEDFTNFPTIHVNHNINCCVETFLNIVSFEVSACARVFDKRGQLLKSFPCAISVHGADAAGVAGINRFNKL